MKLIKPCILACILFCLIVSCKQKAQNHQTPKNDHSGLENVTNNKSIDVASTGDPFKIKYNELSKMSKSELRLARNSIYAKYGREFDSEDLKKYFNSQSWYKINPKYTDDLINNNDKKLVELIMCWENFSKVLWEKQVDLDNDKTIDYCYLLDDLKHSKKLNLVINDQIINFDLHRNKEKRLSGVQTKVVDIDKSDNNKEIWISQHYEGDEDPGKENIFISKVNDKWVKKTLGPSYSAGTIAFLEDAKLKIKISNCPPHTQTYQLVENELKLINKEIGEEPPGGCAACFVAGSKVLINRNNDYKLIKNLKIGDAVLTYDLKTKKQYETTIVDLIEVKHKNLVELYFKHDTIISTDDHPYYVYGKGWSSFKPNSTLVKYSNYDKVNKITQGDYFILNNGKKCQLTGYSYINQEKNTYTITKLKNGNTFYVNGVLVGVEEINKNPINTIQ